MNKDHSGDRLRLIAAQRDISFKKMADELGTTPQVLNNWFKRGVPAREIQTILDRYGIRRAWLVNGDGLPGVEGHPWDDDPRYSAVQKGLEFREQLSDDDYLGLIDIRDDDASVGNTAIFVPFLQEVERPLEHGKTAVETSSTQYFRLGKLMLDRQNIHPSEAVCITVSGNSMEPVLPDLSTVGVDRGVTTVTDGKMYALDHAGQLRVKLVYRLPRGGLRLRSYNRDEHPDEEYTAKEISDGELSIIGKVFWYSVLL